MFCVSDHFGTIVQESAEAAAELARDFAPEIECKWGDAGLEEIIEDHSIMGVAVVLAGQVQVGVMENSFNCLVRRAVSRGFNISPRCSHTLFPLPINYFANFIAVHLYKEMIQRWTAKIIKNLVECFICSFPNMQVELSLKMLKAGKHVIQGKRENKKNLLT